MLSTNAKIFINDYKLHEEIFGPSTLIVSSEYRNDLINTANHLTATVYASDAELSDYQDLIEILERKAGRIIINGYPTGVEVCDAMVHGGSFLAKTDSGTTFVGTAAISRFTRPICYQSFPDNLLPNE